MIKDTGLIRARANAVQRTVAEAILRTWSHLGVSGVENSEILSTQVWIERILLETLQKGTMTLPQLLV